jgi:hypothetical protein
VSRGDCDRAEKILDNEKQHDEDLFLLCGQNPTIRVCLIKEGKGLPDRDARLGRHCA